MQNQRFKCIFFFVLNLIFVSNVVAGPWPVPKGKAYYKLSEWWLVFDQHYTDSGQIDPNVTTGIYTTAFYGEYGVTDRLTAIAYAPLLVRNTMNNLVSNTTSEVIVEGDAINTIGDIDLGIKYGLTKVGANIPISATLIFGIPTGETNGGRQGNLQTGDGEFNQLLQVDIGTGFSLGKTQAYVSTYTGFNNRTNDFSDEFRYGIEGGINLLNKKLWLIGRLFGIESFKNGATADQVSSTSIFANNSEFTSYSVEAAYYITDKVGVSANIAPAFRGEIIAASPSYSVGVFWDLKK